MRRHFRQQPRTEVTSRGKLRNQIGSARRAMKLMFPWRNLGSLNWWTCTSAQWRYRAVLGASFSAPSGERPVRAERRGPSRRNWSRPLPRPLVIPEMMALSNPAAQSTLRSSDLVAIILTAASFISPHRPDPFRKPCIGQSSHRSACRVVRRRWLPGTLGTQSSRLHRRYPFFKNPLAGRLRTGRATDRPPRAGPPIADRR